MSGIFRDIVEIEDIGLFRKGAGHPLPGQIVACRIGVQKMFKKPGRASLPAHTPPMYDIGRKIHAGVIVQIACLIEHGDELVEAGHAGLRVDDIRR